MQPSDRSFDHPPCFPQATAMRSAASGDEGSNPARMQWTAITVMVVAAVGLDQCRLSLGRSRLARDRRNRIHQRQQLGNVISVSLGQDHRNRDSFRIRKEVMLRAGTTAIGWVRSRFFPAPTARMEELSAMARLKSIRSASRSLDNSIRCKRSHTPASCQSLSQRQQLDPLPQPISRGSMFQRNPERNTNRILVSAARSGTGMRPGYFLPRGLAAGSRGLISSQSSSSISVFGIAPLTRKQCLS
jgi:hypothetical protein